MEESKMAGPVIPDRYREALGKDDPFLALFEAPQKLRKLLKGLTEKQLSRRPAPGGLIHGRWSSATCARLEGRPCLTNFASHSWDLATSAARWRGSSRRPCGAARS